MAPIIHKSTGSSQDCRRGCAEWSNSLRFEPAPFDVREKRQQVYSVIGASPEWEHWNLSSKQLCSGVCWLPINCISSRIHKMRFVKSFSQFAQRRYALDLIELLKSSRLAIASELALNLANPILSIQSPPRVLGFREAYLSWYAVVLNVPA
jgi:hypothetical protein